MLGVTYFLIIAVENYNDKKSFSRVALAEKDALDVTSAFKTLGHEDNNFTILVNQHATKTAIEYHLKNIALKTLKSDRIIIYFAGHGFSINGKSLFAPVDAMLNGLVDTGVSVETILGWLKKANSKRNMLFLDCCHSGFELGEYVRNVTGDFISGDVTYALKDEVYCVGFASCQAHEISNSDAKLKNGVWSHYLVEALSGTPDEDIYDHGILTSDNLQSYLRKKTYEFVKKNTDDHRDQIPIQFGHFSDRFVIEDLNPIFQARAAEKKASSINLTSVSIYDTEEGAVKELPDFQRGYHKVPAKLGSVFDSFIKNVSGDLVKDEIEALSQKIKDSPDYTRKQIIAKIGKGYGTIETPDFVYSIEVSQSSEEPTKYIVKRSLDTIVNEAIIHDEQFNKIFDNHFRHLSFYFRKAMDVNDFIDRVEPVAKNNKFKLKYNPADTSTCKIIFPDSVTEIVIDSHSINITIPQAASPLELIEAYKETSLQLEFGKLNLLSY